MKSGWRDRARIRMTGADPARCLNRMALARIAFWDVLRIDALTLECTVAAKDMEQVAILARRCGCDSTAEPMVGLLHRGRNLLRRPVLVFGLLLTVAGMLLLQNLVWTVQVEGNETIPTERMLQALEEQGVTFGAWGPALDSQSVENRMLNAVPELGWLAVNRTGGCVTVSVSERDPAGAVRDPDLVSNVVASRTGIITELHVLSGSPVVLVGDPVVRGQLLVSGYIDFEDHVQATTALAEIYAQTLYQPLVRIPLEDLGKTWTGRVRRQVVLVVGKKRIKILGNSSIFPTGCDKMVNRVDCTLPEGIRFPLSLEITTCREYEPTPVPLEPETVQRRMETCISSLVETGMVAGTIQELTCQLDREADSYLARGTVFCEEMIARVVPIEKTGDEANGEDRQRGTD